MRRAWSVRLAAVLLSTLPLAAGPAEDALAQGRKQIAAAQPEAALASLDKALAADAGLLEAWYWKGTALLALNRPADAASCFVVVLKKKPTSADSWLGLARARLAQKQFGEASKAIATVLATNPTHAEALALRQQIDEAAGEAATASSGRPRDLHAPGPTLPAPPTLGTRVAVTTEGLQIDDAALAVDAQRMYDYTFGSAPTDWIPEGGRWQVTSRYACEKDWSFFGGLGEGVCAIWNKRAFAGDVSVEAYVAFKHSPPWADEKWYYEPSDLNINLCSSLNELATGYSFIYSGRSGSTTMIRRGQQVLAQTTEEAKLLPQFLDSNPLFQTDETGQAFGKFHRHWWRLEVRKAGNRLSFLCDGQLLLEAIDPNPVEAGHIALWTMHSGMMIARARVNYTQELRPTAPRVVVRTPAPIEAATRVAER